MNERRHVHPDPAAASGVDLEVDVWNGRVARSTVAHVTPLFTHQRGEDVQPLKDLKTGLADDLVLPESEKSLRTAVPRADFSGVGHGERRVAGMFEELEEVAIQHHGPPLSVDSWIQASVPRFFLHGRFSLMGALFFRSAKPSSSLRVPATDDLLGVRV